MGSVIGGVTYRVKVMRSVLGASSVVLDIVQGRLAGDVAAYIGADENGRGESCLTVRNMSQSRLQLIIGQPYISKVR